jgi:hypothetical protein
MTRAILLLLAIAGCGSTRHAGGSSEPGAKRIYNAGEARFAAGEPEQAVSLWRHAITQLPSTEQYDALRHKLILRLAFGQMVAYQHSADLAYLFDAKQMLDRYLVAHAELFGEGAAAKGERDQVYELLTEVERLLEDPPVEIAASSARDHLAGRATASAASADAAAPDAPGTTAGKRRRAREDAEGDERVVVVDTKGRPSVDDPEFKAKLRSWLPEAGLSLTAPSTQPWLPARSYVRLDGRAARLDDGRGGPAAQAVASDVLRAVRPALRACYDGAYARVPADYALATVELTVTSDGTVATPRIVDGVVGDAEGDVCVIEHLEGARLAAFEADGAMTLEVPLMFFFENAVLANEASVEAKPRRRQGYDELREMAPIDALNTTPRPGPGR